MLSNNKRTKWCFHVIYSTLVDYKTYFTSERTKMYDVSVSLVWTPCRDDIDYFVNYFQHLFDVFFLNSLIRAGVVFKGGLSSNLTHGGSSAILIHSTNHIIVLRSSVTEVLVLMSDGCKPSQYMHDDTCMTLRRQGGDQRWLHLYGVIIPSYHLAILYSSSLTLPIKTLVESLHRLKWNIKL